MPDSSEPATAMALLARWPMTEDNKEEDELNYVPLPHLSSSSLFVGHLISNAVAVAGSLLLGIAVPRINVRHCNSLRPRRRRALSRLKKDDGRGGK